jgi:Sad1 / UNC-like C-terminal
MAAITPTYPNTVLGQCWSFRSRPGSSGGTIVIRLGEAIHVQSMSIEHPISSDVAASTSAIRTFHLFGYEEGDDDIRTLHGGYHLGTFEYETLKTIRGSAGRMEFPIVPSLLTSTLETDNTDTIGSGNPSNVASKFPPVRKIRLQIDSNWGYVDYTCLHRIRVHGQPIQQ